MKIAKFVASKREYRTLFINGSWADTVRVYVFLLVCFQLTGKGVPGID